MFPHKINFSDSVVGPGPQKTLCHFEPPYFLVFSAAPDYVIKNHRMWFSNKKEKKVVQLVKTADLFAASNGSYVA